MNYHSANLLLVGTGPDKSRQSQTFTSKFLSAFHSKSPSFFLTWHSSLSCCSSLFAEKNSTLMLKEPESKSAGHTLIQPIWQLLHSRCSARVWSSTVPKENDVLAVCSKSMAWDTTQPMGSWGLDIYLHFLVMVRNCKLYAQNDPRHKTAFLLYQTINAQTEFVNW